MNKHEYSISFVIPCLNESSTLPIILDKINEVCATDLKDRKTEIVVSDNGSTDDSPAIAKARGARVVYCEQRGYGAALLNGIQNAENEVIIFADADDTYDFREAPRLIDELEKGYEIVVGSRINGEIHDGAMPFLHRHLGTPTLNVLINTLYAHNGNRISDCNSGFRCFKKQSFLDWGVKSTGMEFASEMLVKALKSRAKMSEVPISLYPDKRDREPHLRTWRDGMRHLLQILIESPKFFCLIGTILFVFNWAIIVTGLIFGPLKIGFATVFGVHTMLFALMGTIFAMMTWGLGLFLATKVDSGIRIYDRLINMSEDKLFWLSTTLILVFCAFFAVIVTRWAQSDFDKLALEQETVALVAFAANGMLFVFMVITAHMLKRT